MSDIAGTILRKAVKSFRLRGLSGTLRHGVDRLLRRAGQKSERPPVDDSAGRQFDKTHGVDTRRTADPGWLGRLGSLNWIYGQGYQPAPVDQVRLALDQLPAEFRDATFIDIGSGKGRIVLLASLLPFRRVIGIEYDRVLHEVAVTNVESFDTGGKERIELHCLDAAEFRFPSEPLVVFFHHPFDRPIFDVVCRNLESVYREHGQPISVIYFDPICRDVFAASSAFELYSEGQSTRPGDVPFVIYRTRSVPATEMLKQRTS